MKRLQIDRRRPGLDFAMPENTGRAFEQLSLPMRDLVRMDIELLRQLGQRLLALDRGQSHLRLERRCVVPAGASSSSDLLIRGQSRRCQAENPLTDLSRFAGPALQTLQKLTLVAAPNHVAGIISHAPGWCGVIAAEQGPRGGVSFHVLRNPLANPDIDPVMMAHLLWRDEVIELLGQAGYAPKDLRRPRKQLYEILCEAMTLREITASIRAFMAQRQTWRDRPARAPCDGLLLHVSIA